MAKVREPIGYNDAPVETRFDDAFNVQQYVNGIAKFISDCSTPMTISIQGDWGCGKTSIMNMINHVLVPDYRDSQNTKDLKNDRFQTIWFNTWQYSQFNSGDTLAISMISHLLKKLNPSSAGQEILKNIWMFTKAAAAMISDSTVGERFTDGLQQGENILSGNFSDYSDELQKLKDTFSESVNRLNKRVVIFIDDLDRLRPEKAVELLEVLNLFLDCKNCIFVLAIDYEVVTTGIKAKYGDNVGKEKGKRFFDKIIQLQFKVPVNNYDIKKFVVTMLGKMNIQTIRPEFYTDLIRKSIGYNPRGMKRLFNSVKLLDIIMETDVSGEDAFDSIEERQRYLFSAMCMQMGFEELYQFFSSAIIAPAIDNTGVARLITGLTDRELIGTAEEYSPLVELISNDLEKNLQNELDRITQFMVYFFAAIQEEEQNDENCISQESKNDDNNMGHNLKIVNAKQLKLGKIKQQSMKAAETVPHIKERQVSPQAVLNAPQDEDIPHKTKDTETHIGNTNTKIKVKNENQLDIHIGESEIRKLRSCFKRSAITAVTSDSEHTDDAVSEWHHNRRLTSRACGMLNRMKINGKNFRFYQFPSDNSPFSPANTKVTGYAELQTSDGLSYNLGFTLNSISGEPRNCCVSIIVSANRNRTFKPDIYREMLGKLLISELCSRAAIDLSTDDRTELSLPIDILGHGDDNIVNRIVKSVANAIEMTFDI